MAKNCASLCCLAFALLALPAFASDQQSADRCNELASFAGYPDPSVKVGILAQAGNRALFGEAEKACADAVRAFPTEKRYRYQLANVQFLLAPTNEVIAILREAAEEGIAEPQYRVAAIYDFDGAAPIGALDTGSGRVSRADAERYMKSAATQGYRLAVIRYVDWLVSGKVVTRDVSAAKAFLRTLLAKPREGLNVKYMGYLLAGLVFRDANALETEYAEAQVLLGKTETDTDRDYVKPVLARAMRLGLGRPKHVEAARALLATIPKVKSAEAQLERLELALLALPDAAARAEIHLLLSGKGYRYRDFATRSAELQLKGDIIGRDRLAALRDMASAAESSIETAIRFAGEVKHHYRHEVQATGAKNIMARLLEGAELGVPGAVKALIELKSAPHEVFRDEKGAAALRDIYAKKGDVDARLISLRWRGATTGEVPSNIAAVTQEIDALAANGNARAHGLKGFLMAKGWSYRQDIAGAAKELQLAADGGDLEAMIQLADAYSTGAGVAKNQEARVALLRKAASLGSIEAREELVRSKTFVWVGKYISAREGISEAVALYGDGLGTSYGGPFDVARFIRPSQDADGRTDVPRAIMNGFAMSTAARNDELMVRAFQPLPKEIKLEIERILVTEKFLATQPDGFMGPDARTALAAWALTNEPNGFASTVAGNQSAKGEIIVPPRPQLLALLQDDVINKATDAALDAAAQAQGPKQLKAALGQLAATARYGSLLTRRTLVDNYLKVTVVRETIPASEIVGYAIDAMISDGAKDHAQQQFVDIVHALAKTGKHKGLAEGLLNAVRDDARLRESKVLASVFDLMKQSGDDCIVWSKAARDAFGLSDLTKNGCDDAARDALLAWAQAKGPTGIPEKLQREAAAKIIGGN